MKPTAFLFTDAHVAEEGFPSDQQHAHLRDGARALRGVGEGRHRVGIRDEAVKIANAPDTKEGVWAYYVGKCRDNLHTVLAMSPVGETLRVLPLVPRDGEQHSDRLVRAVARAGARVGGGRLPRGEDLPDDARKAIVQHKVMVHQLVRARSDDFQLQLKRYNYVTPKNYLDFISNYRSVLKEERRKIDSLIKRLDGGLSKLVQAAEEVEVMSKKLEVATKEVAVKSAEVKEMLIQIKDSTTKAEARQAEAEAKEKELEVDSARIAIEKQEAEAALEEALPALAEAAEALDNFARRTSPSSSRLRSRRSSCRTCSCVVILKGYKDPSWKGSKLMMNESNFLRSLVEFEKDRSPTSRSSR